MTKSIPLIHNLSVSWLAADTSIENNNGRLKLLLWAQIYPLSEMMRGHARVFVHVTIMANLTHNLVSNFVVNRAATLSWTLYVIEKKVVCLELPYHIIVTSYFFFFFISENHKSQTVSYMLSCLFYRRRNKVQLRWRFTQIYFILCCSTIWKPSGG